MSRSTNLKVAPDLPPQKWPYHYAVLPIKQLFVDESYQRPLTNFVNTIREDPDPALVGTLVVSDRGANRYAVVDGQTRMEGMRTHTPELPCLVYEGLTRAQEADLFERLQTQRKGIMTVHRFRAQVMAGRKEQVEIKKAVESVGFRITPETSEGYSIQAVSALETIYRGFKTKNSNYDPRPDLIRRTLNVIKGTWPKMPPAAKNSKFLRSMAYFLNENPQIDDNKLMDKLATEQPSKILRRGDMLREGEGVDYTSPKHIALAIQASYGRMPAKKV